ncbi:MAG: hypothetical protein JJU29_11170 [Verrucomicrobia bacterium]|nr:hypothetical protein [Verrucomicrobiota bacterium]MCH8512818.1 hypothetical protein [Kiritimatiellia bacterium]
MTNEKRLTQIAPDVNQVYTLDDLRVLYGEYSDSGLYKLVNKFISRGILTKMVRGVYAGEGADLFRVCQRLHPEAYLTCATALAKHLLIGSIPQKQVYAARVGRPRRYQTPLGAVNVFSLKPELYFGFKIEEGLRIAEPEKAYLDAWYFTFKGAKFSFDLCSDVAREDLNRKRLDAYLALYDRRFVHFFRNKGGLE